MSKRRDQEKEARQGNAGTAPKAGSARKHKTLNDTDQMTTTMAMMMGGRKPILLHLAF